MPSQWDPVAEKVFRGARSIAESLEHTWIGTEHVALSMLGSPASLLARKLRALGRDPADLGDRLHAALDGTAGLAPAVPGGVALSTRMRHIVAAADSLAEAEARPGIEERHLLQSLIDGGAGVFVRALLTMGVEPGSLWRATQAEVIDLQHTVADGEQAPPTRRDLAEPTPAPDETAPTVATPRSALVTPRARRPVSLPLGQNPALLDFGVVAAAPPASRTPTLDRLATQMLPPSGLIDRPALLEDLIVALCLGRGAAVLVGGSGVGKSALLLLLARRIQQGDVPPELQGLRVLELPALLMLVGEFETMMVEATEQPILLVFDELHRPLMQDALAGHAILKRLLELAPARMVGTSTPDAFHEHLARDPGLKRRLRVVDVPSTTQDETIAVLEARRPAYESRFSVRIDRSALEAIWNGYVEGRAGPMPAVALDLLEEACVRVRASGQQQVTAAIIDRLRNRKP